ncbi:MAG: hypothetical protein P1U86_04855 [Verrucomicrobiales bacterium]|nr:hypothetical protein [Verrucomicrobiales bacterium]
MIRSICLVGIAAITLSAAPAQEVLVFLRDKSIDESSGIDLSNRHTSTGWTHNDSGGKDRIYQVDLKTGNTVGEVEFKKSDNQDWEDIVTFEDGDIAYLMVCDVGDNLKRRNHCQLCIIPEPLFKDSKDSLKSEDWLNIEFTYEDGPRNCESVAVDVKNRKIILVEKIYPEADGIPGIYELPLPGDLTGAKEELIAKRIGEIQTKNLTGMDISDDGRRAVLRNYPRAWVYHKGPDQSWADVLGGELPAPIVLPLQPQGEGICFSADGKSILLSSENVKQPIWRIPIP